jgi:hypothetical protein
LIIVFSDASGTGYGCYIVETPIDIAHGMWLDSEKGNSSTWKELTAVKQECKMFYINKLKIVSPKHKLLKARF